MVEVVVVEAAEGAETPTAEVVAVAAVPADMPTAQVAADRRDRPQPSRRSRPRPWWRHCRRPRGHRRPGGRTDVIEEGSIGLDLAGDDAWTSPSRGAAAALAAAGDTQAAGSRRQGRQRSARDRGGGQAADRDGDQVRGAALVLIASHMTGRVGKQCRERWFNHLCPAVKKG